MHSRFLEFGSTFDELRYTTFRYPATLSCPTSSAAQQVQLPICSDIDSAEQLE